MNVIDLTTTDEDLTTEDSVAVIDLTNDENIHEFNMSVIVIDLTNEDQTTETEDSIAVIDLTNNDDVNASICSKLPVTRFAANDKTDDCIICIDKLCNGEFCQTLPCFHIFHCSCIRKWLERERACPICRHRL